MKPRQFLQQIKSTSPTAGYLFLGNEQFYRDRCRRALTEAALGEGPAPGEESDSVVEFDLSQQPIEKLLDDARTLSLFATSRLIVGARAEAALPKRLSSSGSPETDALQRYFSDPTPGVVILFEAARYDWTDRDDKVRIERVAKFFASVPVRIELEKLSPNEAKSTASAWAKRLNLTIGQETLAELVELLAGDMGRIANELEKLSLYSGTDAPVTSTDIEALVPEARQSGMYEFSDALARKDRSRALEILDTLAGTGEYWPIQINLLAGLFRHALVVTEQKLRSVQDVGRFFQTRGIRMWPTRARQVLEIACRFSQPELETALHWLFQADRDLRRQRPDDRIIMEQLVLGLTNRFDPTSVPSGRFAVTSR